MPSLRILVDENVPLAEDLFSVFGEVTTVPGKAITRENVRSVDVLIVRSVTPVDSALLDGSSVQFVGTTTIGVDHIETDYLHQRGTSFARAPGSNAVSVVEYVIASLLCLACRRNYRLEGRKVGVIGCGNIGGRLAGRLVRLGLKVIKNDPPLAELADREGRPHDFKPLEEVLAESDVLSIHVPLVRGGEHATYHLFDERRLQSMRAGSWLINTSRGCVVDNEALIDVLKAKASGPDSAIIDVWEGEPAPSPNLIAAASIATPHIAGYSYDGKVCGTLMIAEALARHLGRPPELDTLPPAPIAPDPAPPDPALPQTDWLNGLVVQMYDVLGDDERMRTTLTLNDEARARRFAELRTDYPVRRTFSAHRINKMQMPPAYLSAVRHGIQAQVDEE